MKIITKTGQGFTLIEIMVVVVIIGLLAVLAVPNFMRARTTAQTDVCINNLRQIESAKDQWATENRKPSGVTPIASDISPYLKSGKMPECPASGTYTIGVVGTNAECSLTNHVLSSN